MQKRYEDVPLFERAAVEQAAYEDLLRKYNMPNCFFHAINMKGHCDGPINGICPRIKTNVFDMSEEKDYIIYIDDLFGGLWNQECSAESYIDLNKNTIAE